MVDSVALSARPETVEDVINILGGIDPSAEIMGVTPQAICNMRSRGKIPPKHWPSVIRAAEKHDRKDITLDALAKLSEGKPPSFRRRKIGARR
jgi:hypothetical protein